MLNRRRPRAALPSLSAPSPSMRTLPRRLRTPVLALLALTTYVLLFLVARAPDPWDADAQPALPPLYEAYHAAERGLPQHALDAPFPDGQDAKFFWVANHAPSDFVFDNFTWDRDAPSPYSHYNGKPIPARIPFSTMIAGPIMGAPFPPGSPAPRAVSREWYERVCEGEKRVVIRTETVVTEYERYDASVGAGVLFDKWIARLQKEDARCVEVDEDSALVFEIWLFGSTRILDLWPALKRSPLLTHFAWSPLIHAVLHQNAHLFFPTPFAIPVPSLPSLPENPFSRFFGKPLPAPSPPAFTLPPDFLHTESPTDDAPIPGLLVLHVRKGDFEAHCAHLADWASTFNGFNSFPDLPDLFTPPAGCGGGRSTEAGRVEYMARCAPGIGAMVAKVARVRAEARAPLTRVYVMTNAPLPWSEALKDALRAMPGGWAAVGSSRDLVLDAEQRYVAQAADMLAGQRAQVFVGNGFSSLTSNIVMLRMAKGGDARANRFW
ncbi:hypothetical protein HWV62_19641 [Athelia sp. TMB]|nr:hypothetical protein HWV62_19641 [Athelia sp. TMB]